MYKFKKYWHKAAIIFLSIHSLQGLWQAVKFIFIEYPELEEQLSLGLLTSQQLNEVTTPAIILMITTFINIAMAVRLHSAKEDVAEMIDLIFSTILIIFDIFFLEKIINLNIFQNLTGLS